MKRLRTKLWLLIPVLVLVGAGIASWQLLQQPAKKSQRVVVCTGADETSFPCWQEYYTALVTDKSPEAAFVEFRKAYDTNPYIKTNCHQVAHVIGRTAAKQFSTLADTYAHGDNFCWSGYYHGAIETVASDLGKDKILSEINNVCVSFLKDKPYSFDHYNCVHGMGHGLMAVQDDNLFTALDSCGKFTNSWEQESCYSGVFMENVMNEVNQVESSDYFKADDPLYPCTGVADIYKESCYMMQTSHALLVERYDYSKVFGLCAGLANPFDKTCYQSLGRDVSGQSSSDKQRTIELCMLGPTDEAREYCFTGAVKDFISYHHSDKQGLEMCRAIPDTTLAGSCSDQANRYYKAF